MDLVSNCLQAAWMSTGAHRFSCLKTCLYMYSGGRRASWANHRRPRSSHVQDRWFPIPRDRSENCQVTRKRDSSIGAIWQREGKVVGALLMGSPGPSAEDQQKLRQLAEAQPAAAEADQAFADAGL
ncbi:unnamed protein product [Durusdinium trenchii]|uniref:Uncharacterized protein n=1 Tax=Durusdinium trenchii TaxID=1381693 RepID=A0ABP0R8P2_9DINO